MSTFVTVLDGLLYLMPVITLLVVGWLIAKTRRAQKEFRANVQEAEAALARLKDQEKAARSRLFDSQVELFETLKRTTQLRPEDVQQLLRIIESLAASQPSSSGAESVETIRALIGSRQQEWASILDEAIAETQRLRAKVP